MWLVESFATDHFARPVKSKNPGFDVLQGPSLAYAKVVQMCSYKGTEDRLAAHTARCPAIPA